MNKFRYLSFMVHDTQLYSDIFEYETIEEAVSHCPERAERAWEIFKNDKWVDAAAPKVTKVWALNIPSGCTDDGSAFYTESIWTTKEQAIEYALRKHGKEGRDWRLEVFGLNAP